MCFLRSFFVTIGPGTWTIISDPSVADPLNYRDVILKLSGNHFTLLECSDPTSLRHPIERLLGIAKEIGFPPPQEMGFLLSQERKGFENPEDPELVAAVAEGEEYEAASSHSDFLPTTAESEPPKTHRDTIVSMGYSRESAQFALDAAKGDLNAALVILLDS